MTVPHAHNVCTPASEEAQVRSLMWMSVEEDEGLRVAGSWTSSNYTNRGEIATGVVG